MRTALRALAGAALLTMLASAAQSQSGGVLRIGTEGAYPPFNYLDTNSQLQGFDVEIGRALCAEMRVTCEFVAQEWKGIIPGLLARNYDAIIASMSITEERKAQVDFTDHYYRTPASFMARKNSGILDTSPEGLAGKRIGTQKATTHATYLQEVYKAAGASVVLYETQDEANLELVNGRLDAVLSDKIALMEWLNSADGQQCCAFIGTDVDDPAYYGEGIGIAVRQGDDVLRERFNEAIAAIVANGVYKKINDTYFPFSVY